MRPVKWFYVSIININNLSKSYGSNVVLTGVDLKVDSGDAVSIIGSNGAGKSTTFKLITGQIEPDHGSVIYESKLIISQLEQSLPVSEDTTVREIIRSGLSKIELLLLKQKNLLNDKINLKNY